MPLGNKSDICLQMYFLIGKVVYHFLKKTLFVKLKLNFVLRYFSLLWRRHLLWW